MEERQHPVSRWHPACLLLVVASMAPGPGFTNDDTLVTIDGGDGLRATISPAHGGELASLEIEIEGEWHELVYRARDYSQSEKWRGKAPFLWPAVGPTLDPADGSRGYRIGERFFPMPGHGFVRDRAWRLLERGSDFTRLAVSSDAETREYYPFDFELAVEYRLVNGGLLIRYTVRADQENEDRMPFAIGNHVTFRAPLLGVGAAGSLRFRTDLPQQLIRNDDRTFSGRVVPSPFLGEHAVSSLPRRQAVSLGGRTGPAELAVIDPSGLVITLRHEASAEPTEPAIRFNLWADTGEGFFSPEPWLGTQNALNNGVPQHQENTP